VRELFQFNAICNVLSKKLLRYQVNSINKIQLIQSISKIVYP